MKIGACDSTSVAEVMRGQSSADSVPVRDFVARLRDDHQMLTQGAGENVVRLLPPLIITEADIAEAAEKIGDAFAALDAETAHEHVTA